MDASLATAAATETEAPRVAETSGEVDALRGLEDRILRAVQLVTSLRSEKQTLLSEKSQLLSDKQTLEAQLAAARREALDAQNEIESMRGDREQVKNRIETLLSQMDALGDA